MNTDVSLCKVCVQRSRACHGKGVVKNVSSFVTSYVSAGLTVCLLQFPATALGEWMFKQAVILPVFKRIWRMIPNSLKGSSI